MATLKKAVQQAIPADKPATIGVNLADMGQAAIAAHRAKTKTSSKARIIVKNGTDFEALGVDIADIFLGNESDIKAARDELNQLARVSRATIWLGAAELVSSPDEATTLCESFKKVLIAKGHKRAGPDASDFKTFILAYMKSPMEVVGVVAEIPDYHSAMKELRSIKNDGKTVQRGNTGKKRKPSPKQFANIIEAIAAMDASQLTKMHKAGVSRAKVLRATGEVFEAFKA